MTDDAALEAFGDRLHHFRLDRNLTQADLATEAGVHKNTVFRLEAGHSTQLKNLVRVLRVLGLLDRFESLVPDPVPSPLRQLEALARQRKRAVSKSAKHGDGPASDWSWGDDEESGPTQSPTPDEDNTDTDSDSSPPGGSP